jgi:hypothetical protein
MLNPKVFEYMNYQFGDKVDEYFVYVGIYNNNILLAASSTLYYGFGDEILSHKSFFKFTPTLNELKYIYSELKEKKDIHEWVIPFGVAITDFFNYR